MKSRLNGMNVKGQALVLKVTTMENSVEGAGNSEGETG